MTIRHTAIQVAEIEGCVNFYEELIGFEVLRSFEADDGTRNVFIGHPDPTMDDDAALQLVEAERPVDTGDFEHVALTVDDVDETVADLDDDRIVGGPETLEEDGLRVLFLEDPEGWGVELVEHV